MFMVKSNGKEAHLILLTYDTNQSTHDLDIPIQADVQLSQHMAQTDTIFLIDYIVRADRACQTEAHAVRNRY